MNNDLSSSGSSITSIVCLTENLFIFILCLSLCFALFHLDFIHLQMFSHQTQNLIFSQSDPFVCSKTRTCSASSAHRLKFKWSIRRIEGGPHTHTHTYALTHLDAHTCTDKPPDLLFCKHNSMFQSNWHTDAGKARSVQSAQACPPQWRHTCARSHARSLAPLAHD